MIKIATWNINSVRRRLPLVVDWLRRTDPDALCLQENKVQDHDFPMTDFSAVAITRRFAV